MNDKVLPAYMRLLIDDLPEKDKRAIVSEFYYIQSDNSDLRLRLVRLKKKVEIREFIIIILALILAILMIVIFTLI